MEELSDQNYMLPWGGVIYPKGYFYYAFGNTAVFDCMADMLLPEERIDVLLVGSSDIRNAIYSVWEHREEISTNENVVFHLNDINPCVTARNVVLLEIIATINPNSEDDMEFLWSVWYNHSLTEEHYVRLLSVLFHLSSKPFRPNCHVRFGANKMLEQARLIWLYWIAFKKNIQTSRIQRSTGLKEHLQDIEGISRSLLHMISPSIDKDDQIENVVLEEIINFLKTGDTSHRLPYVHSPPKCTNSTLWVPGSEEWRVHYALCPYMSYGPVNSLSQEFKQTIFRICVSKLTSYVRAAKKAMRKNLKFVMWEADIITLGVRDFPADVKFDFIYTSNTSDQTGLLNLLVALSKRLKSSSAVITTESILWAMEFQSVEEYFNTNIAISANMMPTLLGVHLAEDFNMGKSTFPSSSTGAGQQIDRIRWTAANAHITPLQITDYQRSCLIEECHNLARQCFRIKKDNTSGTASYTSSPWTLVQFLQSVINKKINIEGSDLFSMIMDKSMPEIETFGGATPHGLFRESMEALMIMDRIIKEKDIVEVTCTIPLKRMDLMERCKTGQGMEYGLAVFEDKRDGPNLNQIFDEQENRRKFLGPVHLFYDFSVNVQMGTVKFLITKEKWNRIFKNTMIVLYPKFFLMNVFHRENSVQASSCSAMNVKNIIGHGMQQVETSKAGRNKLHITGIDEAKDGYEIKIRGENLVLSKEKLDIQFRKGSRMMLISAESRLDTLYIDLSCPVVENSYAITISKKTNSMNIKVQKNPVRTNGEGVLPWKKLDIKVLDPIMNMQTFYAERTVTFIEMFSFEELTEPWKAFHADYPFYNLRITLKGIFLCEKSEVTTFCCTMGNPDLYDFQDCLQSTIYIIIKGRYFWKGLPLLVVRWIDGPQSGEMMHVGRLQHDDILERINENSMFDHRKVQGIPCTKKGLSLLRQLLTWNSQRVTQPSLPGAGVWFWDSFLQLRFHQDNQISKKHARSSDQSSDHLSSLFSQCNQS